MSGWCECVALICMGNMTWFWFHKPAVALPASTLLQICEKPTCTANTLLQTLGSICLNLLHLCVCLWAVSFHYLQPRALCLSLYCHMFLCSSSGEGWLSQSKQGHESMGTLLAHGKLLLVATADCTAERHPVQEHAMQGLTRGLLPLLQNLCHSFTISRRRIFFSRAS